VTTIYLYSKNHLDPAKSSEFIRLLSLIAHTFARRTKRRHLISVAALCFLILIEIFVE